MRVTCGPIEDDLLTLQNIHVSQHVWNREDDRRLIARRAAPTLNGIEGVPHQIVPLLEEAGFGWIARLSYIKVSPGLLTALVERWRPETHTFHMPFGEDRSSSYVSLRWLAFLGDFQTIKTYAWGAAVLGCLYRNLCTSTDYKTPSCGGFTLLLQLWAWERFPTILSSPFPPIPPASPIGLRYDQIQILTFLKLFNKF
uniref:Serine/threonine protein phosphatase 7 long form isogeny n=1 Tax=Cajanus cajan TaxID=3821 RepID=A0A151S244_CAJCA|nr:Serine/threonine protein phosphatase 7 long form isogeny [Cajanus cajan]